MSIDVEKVVLTDAKEEVPILLNHDEEKIIGKYKDGVASFTFEGRDFKMVLEKKEDKTRWDRFKTFMGSLMFQVLIGFTLGVIVSGYSMYYYQKYRVDEAIFLRCFVHNNKVYQITERP